MVVFNKYIILILWLLSGQANAQAPGTLFSNSDWGLKQRGMQGRVIGENNNPSTLNSTINFNRNIYTLDNLSFRAGRQAVSSAPWSDRRWVMSQGLISLRYADSDFQNIAAKQGFLGVYNYTRTNNIRSAVARYAQDPMAIDRLSPAEKYDLLLGDLDGSLSNALWAEAKRFNDGGGIAHWMGICEGSAAASMMAPEPTKKIVLRSLYNNIPVSFHGVDLKGLLSFAWSSYGIDIPSIGGRCADTNLNGIYNPDCDFTNPASWHVAMLNLVGMHQGELVFDRSPGLEVWNTPVLAYTFSYINPRTKVVTNDLRSAMVQVNSFADPRQNLRSPGTTFIVGVQMKTTAGERPPTGVSIDGSVPMVPHLFVYTYDLELAANGEIIGGEWNPSSERPDFLWAIKNGEHPTTAQDVMVRGSMNADSVPSTWQNAAQAAAQNMQILSPILNYLVALSAGH